MSISLGQFGKRVHMVGACGVGMAGLALMLREKGFSVSGCDLLKGELGSWLESNSIPLVEGHSADHISNVDWVVRSRAIPDECGEIAAALEKGIPVIYRGEVLPALLDGFRSVAVSGTHGKTTTSSFIAQIMQSCRKRPSWFVGSECAALSGVAHMEPSGDVLPESLLVVEADESDGTAALYHPDISVVTNIEYDHMEHFEDETAFFGVFNRLIQNTSILVVYCGDDPGASGEVARSKIEGKRSLSYGFSEGVDLRAVHIEEQGLEQLFTVVKDGIELGKVRLPVPGRHNISNALAAIAVCLESGVDFEEVSSAIGSVCLPGRRFELVADKGGVRVISDYAHHPSEIKALIDSTRVLGAERLLAVFQPHRYTRTLALGDDFPSAFDGVDELVLCPVYPASEKPLAGGTLYDLYERFRKGGSHPLPMLSRSLEEAWQYFLHNLRDGDVLLVIGAGDILNIAQWAETHFEQQPVLPDMPELPESVVKRDENIGRMTTWGVGGSADCFVEAGSEKDLVETVRWAADTGQPFHLLGGGSNLLISDLGVRGAVVRLAGPEFTQIGLLQALDDGKAEVKVGASVPLARLLSWLEENGLTGLEFLEGVPGLVGGSLRMNAGAAGSEICERVSWIRGLKKSGEVCIVKRNEIDWGYRSGGLLKELVLLEASFVVERADICPIRARRSELAEKRAWMKGVRSAGSTFRNPGAGEDLPSAGELIDNAGLKGRSIGGASVWEAHANFLLADDRASASDIKALIEVVRAEVKLQSGVGLETEVVEL